MASNKIGTIQTAPGGTTYQRTVSDTGRPGITVNVPGWRPMWVPDRADTLAAMADACLHASKSSAAPAEADALAASLRNKPAATAGRPDPAIIAKLAGNDAALNAYLSAFGAQPAVPTTPAVNGAVKPAVPPVAASW